ncbi:Flavin prenyltransferase, UbiX family [Desulfonema limicola]|uniref:Flavin prenyltransferase UbiX n=1 Tax=Desulfonema limicola TaxID=45656 RepID=A0A975B3I9_9BACT|nr:UbiX family flavin prenyltransferase [Desulfonema limicola]QTA78111.1 Flavin prenyltransferase, UbiX family [Desulfonema limicola]
MSKKIVVAICGASGSIYGIRILKALLEKPVEVFLTLSEAGKQVLAHETGYNGEKIEIFLKNQGLRIHEKAVLNIYDVKNLFAPPASGSFRHNGMVIAPCSMKTLGAIASGIADDLIHRAADVCLKEKKPLVLLTRETPLNIIHIENMKKAALAGATIMPPCPGFYTRPKTIMEIIDNTAARVLDQLDIETDTIRWGDKDL